ncbi:MAG: phosphate ABC transporter permease PstA [Thermodesulfobacteriota bacterium]
MQDEADHKADRREDAYQASSHEETLPEAGSREAQKEDELNHLNKRRRAEKRFKAYTLSAVFLAAGFLVLFLVDLIIKGYPALQQAEIRTDITYSPETIHDIDQAFPEPVRDLVSRAAKRRITREAKVAEIRLPVHYGENTAKHPESAIQSVQITKADMPPWKQDFEPAEIPGKKLIQLVGERGFQQIRRNMEADPSLAGTVRKEWLAGSDFLQAFMSGPTDLQGSLAETAVLLESADFIHMRFDAEKYGAEGKTVQEWVLADSHVDQYLKGYDYMKPSTYENPENAPLSPEKAARIDRLHQEGRIALHFNDYFFLNGDSKIPEVAGMRAAVIGSVYVVGLVFLICLPIGMLTSIYLEEFAPDNLLTQTIEVNINNLAAIPSILFGVLGLAAFINVFRMPRSSVLVGAATLALMTLPIIIIATRAALRAVPDSIRRAGFAMGATRWQVMLHHVLPVSISGIMTGSIIGIAKAIGETAPLIIVGLVSFVPDAPVTPTDSTSVMPAQIFSWWSMSLRAFQERAALGILVLLTVLFILNGLAVFIRAKSERSW